MKPASGNTRLNGLEFFRVLAFTCIFFCHYGFGTVDTAWGDFSVALFLALSGFLMYYTSHSRADSLPRGLWPCIRFGYRRMRKLYPLHVIMLLAGMLLEARDILQAGLAGIWNALFKLIPSLLLVQAWSLDSTVHYAYNGVAWYLAALLPAYCLTPWMLRKLEAHANRRRVWLAIGLLAVWQIGLSLLAIPLTQALPVDDRYFIHVWPVYRMGSFVLGCLLGWLFVHRPERACRRLHASCAEAAALALIPLSVLVYQLWRDANVFLPCVCCLIYLFAKQEGVVSKALSNRVVLYLAGLTPYAFLIHQLLGTYLIRFEGRIFGARLWLWQRGVVGLVITLLCCEGYRRLEKLFFQNRRRLS